MSTSDYAIMLAFVFSLSWAVLKLKERIWPPRETAGSLGYMPDSETPPWGWLVVIALGLAAFGLLLFGPTMAGRIIGL